MLVMRKKICSLCAALFLAAFLFSSCQKENIKPNQSVKQEAASSGTVTGATPPGSTWDAYDPNHHPTCPNHGG
jgi:hypothetical protein